MHYRYALRLAAGGLPFTVSCLPLAVCRWPLAVGRLPFAVCRLRGLRDLHGLYGLCGSRGLPIFCDVPGLHGLCGRLLRVYGLCMKVGIFHSLCWTTRT